MFLKAIAIRLFSISSIHYIDHNGLLIPFEKVDEIEQGQKTQSYIKGKKTFVIPAMSFYKSCILTIP